MSTATAAVYEKSSLPSPSPVIGSKYSRIPAVRRLELGRHGPQHLRRQVGVEQRAERQDRPAVDQPPGGELSESLAIVNTSGWDTDCNAGNVGCVLGIRGGVAATAHQWREPVADRMYLSSADGGRAVTDAATETVAVVNAGGALAIGPGTAVTPTFILPEALDMTGYELQASPSLYSGQTIRARVEGWALRLVVRAYDGAGELVTLRGPEGATEWRVPDAGGRPIAQVGIEASGHVRLDRLGWDGAPLRPDAVRLVRELDGPAVLAEAPLERRDYGEPHALALRVTGSRLVATVDGETVLDAEDGAPAGGAVALACEEGCLTCGAVRVRP